MTRKRTPAKLAEREQKSARKLEIARDPILNTITKLLQRELFGQEVHIDHLAEVAALQFLSNAAYGSTDTAHADTDADERHD